MSYGEQLVLPFGACLWCGRWIPDGVWALRGPKHCSIDPYAGCARAQS